MYSSIHIHTELFSGRCDELNALPFNLAHHEETNGCANDIRGFEYYTSRVVGTGVPYETSKHLIGFQYEQGNIDAGFNTFGRYFLACKNGIIVPNDVPIEFQHVDGDGTLRHPLWKLYSKNGGTVVQKDTPVFVSDTAGLYWWYMASDGLVKVTTTMNQRSEFVLQSKYGAGRAGPIRHNTRDNNDDWVYIFYQGRKLMSRTKSQKPYGLTASQDPDTTSIPSTHPCGFIVHFYT